MKIKDLINICIHNLFRHKSRTILTVLGVIVGCCSVVIMISFGIAMKISQESMLAEMGDLQIINIYNARDDVKITEKTIDSIENMENVIGVNPKMGIRDIMTSVSAGESKRFKTDYTNIMGIKKEAIDSFGYEISEGRNIHISTDNNTIEALAGKYFAYSLYDTQRPSGSNYIDYWSYVYGDNNKSEDMPDPYVDVLNTVFEITLGDPDPNSSDKVITKKFKIVGILEEDYSKGSETSDGLLVNSEDIKKLIKEYNLLNNIPQKGQQSYDNAAVKVNDIKNVKEVENKIKDMGYYTSSLESIREPMEKEVRQKQLMFAGLGIVSLFVAALGIMNTMIMAISERKREIGVMKALGCLVGNIRTMFLLEAGFIGLIGGILGSLISFVVSAIINLVSTETEIIDWNTLYAVLFVNTDRVSVIPVWLAISAVIFSVLVGIASGYYPANSAIKISALDAIRAE